MHGLKSNGRTLGSDSFADLASDMEKACKNIIEQSGEKPKSDDEHEYENWESYIEKNHELLMELYSNVAASALDFENR